MRYVKALSIARLVLIDTWWNVNEIMYALSGEAFTCFNRYMVECELTLYMTNYLHENGFNRYMVECE